MAAGQPEDTEVFVIETFTVVAKRESDGDYTSEVMDLPGITARAETREDLIKKTKNVIFAFLGKEE